MILKKVERVQNVSKKNVTRTNIFAPQRVLSITYSCPFIGRHSEVPFFTNSVNTNSSKVMSLSPGKSH